MLSMKQAIIVGCTAVPISLVGAGIFLTMSGLSVGAQDDSGFKNVRLLDQGWSEEDRLKYYFTSQGSAAMSYDIFLNLETVESDTLLRADAEIARFGAIPYKADPIYNPDGLPIGFTKASIPDGQWKGDWVGLGCAACHNGRLEYQDQQISISGGNAGWFDFYGFIGALDASLAATVSNEEKFVRLADRIGGDRDALRLRLEADAKAINGYLTDTALVPHPPGPGRMDALGLIHNQVQDRALDVPQNWSAPLAPTKPSFVWNMPQSAWVQWSGVLSDPLFRNGGEVMGVFARMDLSSASPEEGLFQSTIDLKGQIESEELLRRLAPPQWPEDLFGEVDDEKAAKGAVLFAENCSSCHSNWPHRWSEPRKLGKVFIENAIVKADVIGTDPMQFRSPQFDLLPTARSGSIADKLFPPFTGQEVLSPADMFRGTLQPGIVDAALANLNLTVEEESLARSFSPFGDEPPNPLPVFGGYKANPIEGMWASPPFLHNGSVPTLYDLLAPASERPKVFFVGREYDPVKVGIDTSGGSGNFEFNAELIGNSNAGHSFEDAPLGQGVIGRKLSEDERWALIEYVKSAPSEPAQITPFGGPENPVQAWKDESFYHVQNPGTFYGAPTGE